MTLPSAPAFRSAEAEAFFRTLLAPAPEDCAAVVSALPSRESVALSADNFEGLVAAAAAAEGAGQDAYVSACLVGTGFDAAGRGRKADYRAAVALWADVDVRSLPGAHRADPERLPPNVEDAAEVAVAAVGLDPTMVVSSGHGLHLWWCLSEPERFGAGGALSPEGRRFSAAVEALQCRVREAFAPRGWGVDVVADVPRILRVPGTTNRKLAASPRPVELLISDGPRRPFIEFLAVLGVPAALGPAGPAPSAGQGGVITAGPAPAPDLAVVRERLAATRSARNRKFAERFLAGESFAEPGARDAAVHRAASLIAFVEPDADPRALAEILRPSLAIWAAEPSARLTVEEELSEAAEKLARAQVDARARKAERAARNDGIARVVGALGAAPPAATVDAPADGSSPYSDDDLARFAAAVGCSREDLDRRWIVQHKGAYFVLVDGSYSRPIVDKELDVSLPRDLARAPVALWVPKANGEGFRRARPVDILAQHATVARTLVSSLSAQGSSYVEVDQTFVEAVCPLRAIAPRFDDEVDRWLRAFFGSEVEKGLDWTATLAELDRYTCAIYLSGPPATGKTLFANGLARLWTVGGPSELGRILESFNEDLVRCPLVFADEHIPSSARGARTSTELRNLIGSVRRTLNRKFLPQAPLVGAIRLILAANNDRLLAFSEDLSQSDLEAVAERFLHVDTSGAQGFWDAFPGGKAPESWVEDDVMAAHALWLRENRPVSRSGRFLVSGSMSKMLRLLATEGPRTAGSVEWIAKYLAATPAQRKPVDQKRLVLVGNGELLVNVQAVADHWGLFVTNDRPPTTTKIGRALAGLAVGRPKDVGGLSYHVVNVELVLGWMASNQVGNVEVARALVETPA